MLSPHPAPTPNHHTPRHFLSCLPGVEQLQNHLRRCPGGSDGELLADSATQRDGIIGVGLITQPWHLEVLRCWLWFCPSQPDDHSVTSCPLQRGETMLPPPPPPPGQHTGRGPSAGARLPGWVPCNTSQPTCTWVASKKQR